MAMEEMPPTVPLDAAAADDDAEDDEDAEDDDLADFDDIFNLIDGGAGLYKLYGKERNCGKCMMHSCHRAQAANCVRLLMLDVVAVGNVNGGSIFTPYTLIVSNKRNKYNMSNNGRIYYITFSIMHGICLNSGA